MSVKLNHYWSIIPGKDDEYMKFIINQFIPGVNALGMHTVAVWSVLIGAYSEVVFETASGDLEIIEKGLKDKAYKALKQKLGSLVYDYKTKVLDNTGKVDSYIMDVRQDTLKFNQMCGYPQRQETGLRKVCCGRILPAFRKGRSYCGR